MGPPWRIRLNALTDSNVCITLQGKAFRMIIRETEMVVGKY